MCRLVVPFLCVGLLFHITTNGPITKYWFLRTLFIITLINIVYEAVREKYRLGAVSDGLFYIVSFSLLFMAGKILRDTLVDELVDFEHLSNQNYLAFCLGIVVRRYNKFRIVFESNRAYSLCLFFFILLLFPQIPVPQFLRVYLMCISGIVSVWYLMKNVFIFGPIISYLEKIGRYSLEIYLIHFFLSISIVEVGDLFLLLACGKTYISVLSCCTIQLLYGLVVTSLICMMCIVGQKLISSSKIWSAILLGKESLL